MSGTNLGKAYVQIVPSAEGISGSISSVLSGEASSAGTKTGATIGQKAIKALKAAGLGLALKKTIGEGAALEQSIGGIETMFKDSSDKMKQYANEAYRTAGLSANAYMEQATSFSAALLQSLGGDTSKAADSANQALIDMSDNANKFGTDMQNIQNAYQGFSKQNYTMLDNLKLGYGGTKSEMERLLADAEKLSGQDYSIDNLNDVYEAIHVIQEEMGVTGTTAKEAAETLSGSFAMMKASATNLLGALTLGDAGIQTVTESMTELVQSSATFLFGNLIPAIGRVAMGIPPALVAGFKAAVPLIAENVGNMITSAESALPRVGEFVVSLGNKIVAEAPSLMTSASQLIDRFTAYLSENGPALLAGAGRVVGQLALGIIRNLPQLATGLARLGASILKFIGTLPGIAWNGAKSFITNMVKGMTVEPIRKAMNKIKAIFKTKLSFPKIKVPHFKISGGEVPWGIGGMGTAPKIDIKWYKTGGIFSDPSVIGVGEAGTEAVVPLNQLWDQMDKHSGNIDYDRMADALVLALSRVNITSTTNLDGKVVAKQTAPLIQKELEKLTTRNNRKLGYI